MKYLILIMAFVPPVLIIAANMLKNHESCQATTRTKRITDIERVLKVMQDQFQYGLHKDPEALADDIYTCQLWLKQEIEKENKE